MMKIAHSLNLKIREKVRPTIYKAMVIGAFSKNQYEMSLDYSKYFHPWRRPNWSKTFLIQKKASASEKKDKPWLGKIRASSGKENGCDMLKMESIQLSNASRGRLTTSSFFCLVHLVMEQRGGNQQSEAFVHPDYGPSSEGQHHSK